MLFFCKWSNLFSTYFQHVWILDTLTTEFSKLDYIDRWIQLLQIDSENVILFIVFALKTVTM